LDPLWRQFLNYVHVRGGWRGKEIDWNPEENVLPDGKYTSERQAQEDKKLEETMARLRAMIIDKHAEDGLNMGDVNADYDGDSEEEDAAAFERPILREAE
jgi:helicase MOV-10